MLYQLQNTRTTEVLAERAAVASTIFTRLRGLLFRAPLGKGEALIIRPCKQVHMFFMSYPLDLVFCSPENTVIDLQPELKPWRISRFVVGCRSVIELPGGTLARMDIRVGDALLLQKLKS